MLTIVIYKKTIASLTPQDNCKKTTKVTKPKMPLYLGQKKVDPRGMG
jgi:hypothetical protein